MLPAGALPGIAPRSCGSLAQYGYLGQVYDIQGNLHAACDAFTRALYRFQQCGDWVREATVLQMLVSTLVRSAERHKTTVNTAEVQENLYRYAQLLHLHPEGVDAGMAFRRRLSAWGLELPRVERGQRTAQGSPGKADETGAFASAEVEVEVEMGAGLTGLADTLPVSDLREHSFSNIPFSDVVTFHEADTAQAGMVLKLVDAHEKAVACIQDGVKGVFENSSMQPLVQQPATGLWHGYLHQVAGGSATSEAEQSSSLHLRNEAKLQSWLAVAARQTAQSISGSASWLGSAFTSPAGAGGGAQGPGQEPTVSLTTLGLADPGLAGSGLARTTRANNEQRAHAHGVPGKPESAPAPAAAPSGLWASLRWSSKDAASPSSGSTEKEASVANSTTLPALTSSSVQRACVALASFACRAVGDLGDASMTLRAARQQLKDVLLVQGKELPAQLLRAAAAKEALLAADAAQGKATAHLEKVDGERQALQASCDEAFQQLAEAQQAEEAQPAERIADSAAAEPASPSRSLAAARKRLEKLRVKAQNMARSVAAAETAVDAALGALQQASEARVQAKLAQTEVCRDVSESIHAAAVRRGAAVESALSACAALTAAAARTTATASAVAADSVAGASSLSDIATFTHMARMRHLMHQHDAQAASQAAVAASRSASTAGSSTPVAESGVASEDAPDADAPGPEAASDPSTSKSSRPRGGKGILARLRGKLPLKAAPEAEDEDDLSRRAGLVVPDSQSRTERAALSSQYASDEAVLDPLIQKWVQDIIAGRGRETYDYASRHVEPPLDVGAACKADTEAPLVNAKVVFSRAAGRALFLKYLSFYRTSGMLHRDSAWPVDAACPTRAAVSAWLATVRGRGEAIPPADAFHRLGRAIWWLLDASLVHCDLGVARSVMILSETFGCCVAGAAGSKEPEEKVFLQRLVAHHRIWSNAWIWEELFHRSIRHDVHRLLGVGAVAAPTSRQGLPAPASAGGADASHHVNLVRDWPGTYTNHVFSHLGSFALNMRLFCVPERLVNTVIARLAANHGLPEPLMGALSTSPHNP